MTKSSEPAERQKHKSGGARCLRAAKTEATRREITRAARNVFSHYPYDAAGIRTIGREGGFTHSFIRYHFKSKAGLFEAVSRELIEEYYCSTTHLIEGLNGPLIENTRLLTKRVVDFAFDHPQALDMILLNMGALDQVKGAFPGMDAMCRFHEKILELFASSDYFSAPVGDVNRVFFCFSIILANCIGASRFFGRLLDMDPDSREYRRWVRTVLFFLFYPTIKQLVFNDTKNTPDSGYGTDQKGPEKKAAPETMYRRQPADEGSLLCPERSGQAARKTLSQMETDMGKGRATRCRIITVARRVFSRYPYNAASIRMIGEAGDFDFTLLYHYFPRKEELFEAVAETLLEEYMISISDIVRDLNGISIRRDMSVFIANTLDFCRAKSDVMKICMQNIAQVDNFENHPGFDVLVTFLMEALRLFRETVPLRESDERVRMWMYGFGIVVFNCLGAPSYHARILKMKPGSKNYRKWLQETLLYVFYPSLKDLIKSNTPEMGRPL